MRTSIAVLFALTFALFSGEAQACSCVSGSSACRTRLNQDHMIFGTVLRVRVVGNEHTLPDGQKLFGGGRRIFTVSVVEDFGGTHRAGDEIEVETGMGGGDCGYDFQLGQRYLIDAYAHDGKLSAGICGHTYPEGAAAVVLRELREASAGRPPAVLSGSVVHYRTGEISRIKSPEGVGGVPVTITGTHGMTLRLQTGADGAYEVQSLPPGDYSITFQLPEGLSAWNGMQAPVNVNIPSSTAQDILCHASLPVYSAGRLEGRISNDQGAGVPGFLSVYAHAPTGSPPGMWSSATSVGSDGQFSVGPLEAGTYWLYFEPKSNEKQQWYYPGVRQPADAVPIQVKEGIPASGLSFAVDP